MNRFHKMKTRNTFSSALTLCALAVGLVAAVVWNALPVSAIKEVDGRTGFGVISLAAGQTARLNVVNTRAIDPEDATTGEGSAKKVTLAFDIYAPARRHPSTSPRRKARASARSLTARRTRGEATGA